MSDKAPETAALFPLALILLLIAGTAWAVAESRATKRQQMKELGIASLHCPNGTGAELRVLEALKHGGGVATGCSIVYKK